MSNQDVVFDTDLIKRYDKAGPRYTSYPTAVQFHEGFGQAQYRECAQKSNAQKKPLSLYFHIPFCDTVCFYCGCNKIATKERQKTRAYLEHLEKEIKLQAALFDDDRSVNQLHWGGGTPTFLNDEEIVQLMDLTRQHFHLKDDDSGEYSIEIDPREATAHTIAVLREQGFNRMSLGVQDFDPKVQKAVNRIQTEEETFAVMQAARDQGFQSISIDLIYGLPHQNTRSFMDTLDKIIAVNPDRLSVFNYAHMPTLFKPQRRINEDELPSSAEKLSILQHTIERLTAAGYVYIGMDHFSKPDDELAVAQRNGSLYRNFQGYATHADCDLIGFGCTSIGKIANSYSQNLKTLDDYYHSLDNGHLPVFRGVTLDADDELRRAVITQLMCHFSLHMDTIEQQYQIQFNQYFADELADLLPLQEDGLLVLEARSITVSAAGRLLIRNVCMVFDKYLREKRTQQRFSKVI